jgi:hypothetical protein
MPDESLEGLEARICSLASRLASALTGLPVLDAAFGSGQLSYSKVRAVTRVADRVDEQTLLEQTLVHTAAQLERVIRGYRKADRAGLDQQQRRRARWFFDDDGMLILTARLPADEGAIVVAALEQAAVCRIENGSGVDRSTAERIACDAALVALIDSATPGEQMRLGRKTRKISPALRRALRIRDGGCRFPGCHRQRHLEAHHVIHWLRGGLTDLDNLVLLCRRHHMAIHEEGFTVSWTAPTTTCTPHWEFHRPDGEPVPANPTITPSPDALDGTDSFDPELIRPGWRGEPFGLADSVGVLCRASFPRATDPT